MKALETCWLQFWHIMKLENAFDESSRNYLNCAFRKIFKTDLDAQVSEKFWQFRYHIVPPS